MKRSHPTGRSRSHCIEPLESRTLLTVGGLPINIGGSTLDSGKRVAFTPDGGYVAVGIFGGTVDFDPGSGVTNLKAQSDSDIYVAKYAAGGALQWARRIGGYNIPGGLLAQGVIDFASSPLRAGFLFYTGVSSDPRSAAEVVNDIAVAPDGSIILVGSFIGAVDFDPGPGTKIFHTFDGSYPDGFVMKLTSTGTLAWANQYGGNYTDIAAGVALDASGNAFVTGFFSRTVSFVPGNPSFTREAQGRADAYVMKLSTAGKVQWIDTFGAGAVGQNWRDAASDVAIDKRGNVFVVGTYVGAVDFNPSPTVSNILTSVGNTDGFLVKLDNRGNYLGAVSFGNAGYDGLTSVAIDANNSPAVSGYFQGFNFDADPGPGKHYLQATGLTPLAVPIFTDAYIVKLNANLQFQWVQQLAGTGYELIDQIKFDSTGSLVVGGSYYGSAVFGLTGPTLTSVLGTGPFYDYNDGFRLNSYDPFLWKLSSTGTTTWVVTWGSSGDDIGTGLDVASDNSILFTGRFHGSVDFDPGPGTKRFRSEGVSNAFVTGFLASGSPMF